MTFPQAIIFDMDGLLVDSEPVWALSDIKVVEAHGKDYDPAKQSHLVGLRSDEFLSGLCEVYGIEADIDQLSEEVHRFMLELIPDEVRSKPGAHELVAYVAEQRIPRSIASSSPMSIIERTVETQGWDDVFAVRCSGDEVPRGKPAPDVYLLAAERIGVDPAQCLALEDSPTGARAAIAAGMTCYAVPDLSHTTAAAFDDITPHVFDDLHAVRAALQSGAFVQP